MKLALLWHMHQPPYRSGKDYLLPWTRLHGTKDYLDTARALEEFPGVRGTINLVPSLLLQLKEYASGNADDRILHLTRTPAFLLSDEEKMEIVKGFFQCNVERMILPYPRYAELYRKVGEFDDEPSPDAVASMSAQDWLDLQVWYLLTWIGPRAREENPLFEELMQKGEDFLEREKLRLIDASLELIGRIIPLWKELRESGRIDLSVSPFYHPILPLLIDLRSARDAMPEVTLPEARTGWREDASLQIGGAVRYFTEEFGVAPTGMWPSEGSISRETLEIIRRNGLQWTASDETVLNNSLGEEAFPLSHCFPWTVATAWGDLHLFFRDHQLSDRIGFVYSDRDPEEAAEDFVSEVLKRREALVEMWGEEILEEAVLPVILDGENCWEYYEENGRPFLEALYRRLSESDRIETVTFSDVAQEIGTNEKRRLKGIRAGSWIGGNFRIWIGDVEENRAWQALADARRVLMEIRDGIPTDRFHAAYEELLAAEASDWFWWYGDENTTVNDPLFDQLFREHLRNIYLIAGAEPPVDLDEPIRNYTGRWTHGGAMHRAEYSS